MRCWPRWGWALPRASEAHFLVLKLVGAGYLVYLGIAVLRAKSRPLAFTAGAPVALWRLFFDGAMSNWTSPKVAVFDLAFLPQFVLPGATHAKVSVFVLGRAFAVMTILVKGPVGLGAGLLAHWLRARPSVLAGAYRTSGAVLVGLGPTLAFERRA